MLADSLDAPGVLRLALDGHLTLSMHLVNGAYGRKFKAVDLATVEWEKIRSTDGQHVLKIPAHGRIWIHNQTTYQLMQPVVLLEPGLWDVPLIGGERVDAELKIQQMSFGPEPTSVSLEGVLIKHLNGDLFEIQSRYPKSIIDQWKRKYTEWNKYHPAGALPEDSEFVVRTESAEAFIKLALTESEAEEKPLSTRERDTLLTIIGALCKDAGYEIAKHSKTAGLIQNTAACMGVSIGESTIEGHLKKVPSALAGRMK